MESKIASMQKADSLHVGQGDARGSRQPSAEEEDEDGSDKDSDAENGAPAGKAGIRVDTKQLEKKLSHIGDRLKKVEYFASPEGPAGNLVTGTKTADQAAVESLCKALNNRLASLEAMVESSDNPSRPSSQATDEPRQKGKGLTSKAADAVALEAGKASPSIPKITSSIFKEITALTQRVRRFEDTLGDAAKLQDEKDKAQDEALQMEMDNLHQDISQRAGKDDIDKIERKFKQELRMLKSDLEERQDKNALRISNEIGNGVRVLRDQVKTINEATQGITANLDARLKKLEKKIEEDMEDLEERLRIHIADTISNSEETLRAEAVAQAEKVATESVEVRALIEALRKEHLALGARAKGDHSSLDSALARVNETLRSLLEQGGFEELIRKVATPAVTKLDERLKREIASLQDALRLARQTADDDKAGLDDKFSQATKELRELLENDLSRKLEEAQDGLDRLSKATGDQVSVLHAELEKARSEQLEAAADLARQLAAADLELGENRAGLGRLGASLDSLQLDCAAKFEGADARLGALEAKGGEHAQGLADCLARLAQEEKFTRGLEGLVTDTASQVGAAHRAVERLSKESRQHKQAMDLGLCDLGEELKRTLEEHRGALVGLERKAKKQVEISDDLRDSFSILVTKESFWDVMEKRTHWHAERLAKYCNETEGATNASTAPKLSKEASEHLSGHAQRIAKVIAAQADATVIEDMVKFGKPKPEDASTLAMQWDEKVDSSRHDILEAFVLRVDKGAKRLRPSGMGEDHYFVEARGYFMDTLR